MADAVAHFIRRIGRDNIHAGDVYITNDPWEGTGHLHDITMVTPSFHGGALVGFFACTAHIVDIGGRGFGADAHSVYEERLVDMMEEFALSDLDGIAGFILENSRRATIERIAALPQTSATGEMTMDGFDRPITLKVKVTRSRLRRQKTPSSTRCIPRPSRCAISWGISCPMRSMTPLTRSYRGWCLRKGRGVCATFRSPCARAPMRRHLPLRADQRC